MKEKVFLFLRNLTSRSWPKKGRIRLVLALFLLVGGFFFCLKHKSSGTHDGAAKTAAPVFEPVPESVTEFLIHRPFDTTLLASETLITGTDTQKIHLTLDDVLQKRLFQLLVRYKPRCGAAIVMKPATGEVLAAVSYRNPRDSEWLPDVGNMLFWNEYPAASLFKMVTAAGAMEYGLLNPDDVMKVSGSYYTLYRSQLSDRGLRWARRISIREAFSKSVNPLFGMIGQRILGRDRLNKTAERFLFNQAIRFDLPILCSRYVPPMDDFETAERACGFNRSTLISPLHAVLISGSIGNGGTIRGPYLVDFVIRANKLTYQHGEDTTYSLVSRETSLLMQNIMAGVVRDGTARKGFKELKRSRRFDHLQLGGKTGSMDGINPRGRCDWFAGFARDPAHPNDAIAMAVITVHGAFWTVHSSYLAAEAVRSYFERR